jgi:hypothetical protein
MMDEDNSAAEWAAGSQLQEEPLETTKVRLRKDFF